MQVAMGIMDPTLAYQEQLTLAERDLQALDLLGWDMDYAQLGVDLDMEALLIDAEQAVAQSLGLDSAVLSEHRSTGSVYTMGFSEWWVLFEKQIIEMGFSEWWQQLDTYFSTLEDTVGQQFSEGSESSTEESAEATIGVVTSGGAQDDILAGSTGRDLVSGGGGDDLIDGKAGNEILLGDDGNDLIYGLTGDDQIYGGEGNDFISGEADNDKLYVEAGADIISGGFGNDLIEGGAGKDLLKGDSSKDLLDGGTGDDSLEGGDDNDILIGG